LGSLLPAFEAKKKEWNDQNPVVEDDLPENMKNEGGDESEEEEEEVKVLVAQK